MTATQAQFRTDLAETANTGPWRGVYFDGPQPDRNADGDEVPVWCVYVGDEEAEPVNRIYWLWSYAPLPGDSKTDLKALRVLFDPRGAAGEDCA